MLMMHTWKVRPLGRGQIEQMMEIWGKIEADLVGRTDVERLCWFTTLDGKRGVNVLRVTDPDSVGAFMLEVNVALSEFMEAEICQVADLDMAIGAIANGLERIPA